jgi:hypothetical protein
LMRRRGSHRTRMVKGGWRDERAWADIQRQMIDLMERPRGAAMSPDCSPVALPVGDDPGAFSHEKRGHRHPAVRRDD